MGLYQAIFQSYLTYTLFKASLSINRKFEKIYPMRHTQTELKRSVISVLAYFDFFQYPITTDELYRFFPYKTSIQEVKKTTNSMAKNRKIESIKYKGGEYYTILEHGINLRKRISRKSITTRKINKISTFVKLISFFSQIKIIPSTH